MNFLRQLFARDRQPVTLAAPGSGELCQVLAAQAIPPGSLLSVASGQNALLFNGTNRSTIYPSGEHPLDIQELRGIVDGGEANILFLQITPPVKRSWQVIYRAEGHPPMILAGDYTAAIDDTRHFVAALLDDGTIPESRQIDSWLNQYIRQILKDQRVPGEDVFAHTDRLTVFLHDALIPFLLDHGIRLQHFTLHLEDNNPPSAAAPVAQPVAPVQEERKIPENTDTAVEPVITIARAEPAPRATPPNIPAPPAPAPQPEVIIKTPAPKIFYRLQRGEQVGPYSVDDIKRLIEAGDIRKNDLLWHQGMKSWQKASEFSVFEW